MTREEKRIYAAAKAYADLPGDGTLATLVTAVMDLPLKQWPEGACGPEHKPKRAKAAIAPLIVHRGPKPEEGDAAHPDKIIDLETGERKLP